MGNAEGEFRGCDDVALSNAINGMSDEEVQQAIAHLAKTGVFAKSGIADGSVKTKFDLQMNLDKFPKETKEEIIAALQAGENPFEDY